MRDDAAPPAPPGATGAATRPDEPAPAFSRGLRLGGAVVHLYTASGSVLALLIVIAAMGGHTSTALWLGLATLFIDGTDGMLARRFRVKETIPWFDGARLDDIVDYLTYVFAPVVLLWTTDRLPTGVLGWVIAALPLLTSSFQFCRVDAKTSDHFFLGFPSYWNIVAFYVIVMGLAPTTAAVLFVVCSILVFVPVRYVYPSRTEAFQTLTLALTGVWLVTYAVLVAQLPHPNSLVLAVSLAYVGYYLVLSGYLTALGVRRRRALSVQGGQGG